MTLPALHHAGSWFKNCRQKQVTQATRSRWRVDRNREPHSTVRTERSRKPFSSRCGSITFYRYTLKYWGMKWQDVWDVLQNSGGCRGTTVGSANAQDWPIDEWKRWGWWQAHGIHITLSLSALEILHKTKNKTQQRHIKKTPSSLNVKCT